MEISHQIVNQNNRGIYSWIPINSILCVIFESSDSHHVNGEVLMQCEAIKEVWKN